MDFSKSSGEEQPKKFRGTCPFCLSQIDVLLDIKGRPYWWCWRCELRTFATRKALTSLKANGWIWDEEQPLQLIQGWIDRVIDAAGLKKEKKD